MSDLPKNRGTGCQPVQNEAKGYQPVELPPLNDELADLLESLCLEELSTADAARLEELVSSDPDCCHQYIVFMQMHAMAERFAGKWQDDSSVEDDEELMQSRKAFELPCSGNFIPESPSPFSLTPHPSPLSPSSVGGWAFSYIVASVVLCLMLLGGWAYKITQDDQSADNRPQKAAPGVDAQFVSVGKVSGMKDCVWANGGMGTMVGASVPLDREYALLSGLLEIEYAGGARVILEGPCEYTADSRDGGFLRVGKLVARVEKKAASGQWPVESGEKQLASAKPQADASNPKSLIPSPQSPAPSPQPLFSVRTPSAVITDLGTEFGVEVAPGGRTETHVLEGVVRVIATANGAKNRSRICRLGESALVEPDESGVQVIPDNNASERFVRFMPSSMTRSQAYADYVLSLDPAVYYRMEQPGKVEDQRLVRDFASGGRHGKLLLGDEYGGSPYRPGRFGNSLYLRGPDTSDRVIVPDYPKATGDRLTVSAWVMAAGRPGWAQIANNWSGMGEDRSYEGQFQLALYRQDGDLCARVRQRNGEVVEVRERVPLPLFEWHHVALVLDGDMARLYRNGREVDRRECVGVLPNPPVSGLGIGCRLNPTSTDAVGDSAPGYDYWQGRIDEMAVFNEALSGNEVQRLYEAKHLSKENETKAALD